MGGRTKNRFNMLAGGLVLLVMLSAACGDDTTEPTPTPAPTLTAVSPDQGSALGGTQLTLTGTNFASGATVRVGGTAATQVTVVSSTSITCLTPAGTTGAVDVSVTTSGGTATLADAFTYNAGPALTSVAPGNGTSLGGTALTLTGTGFTANGAGTNTVTVGGAACTGVNAASDTQITCTSPAGTAGATVNVTVGNLNGSTTLTGGFTYNAAPTITTVGPNAVGAVSGGMHHTITGTGFVDNAAGTNTVTIGGNPCTNIATVDDTTITCDSPPGAAAGATTLDVTNANGSASSAFTYFDPIWGAEGGGCQPSVADCTFFVIDPATGSSYTIGPIGFGVTGMFYTGGTLLGTTSSPPPFNLATIDPLTGVGTLVGPTIDGAANNYNFRDVTFDNAAAWPYGVTGPPCDLRRFSSSGIVDPAIGGGAPICAPGAGIAQDAPAANIYFMVGMGDPLFTVNTSTGVFAPGPIVSGGVLAGTCFGGVSCFTASGFHNGTLYTVETDAAGGNRQLHSVNTATGVLTPVGPPLPSWTSAIVSATR